MIRRKSKIILIVSVLTAVILAAAGAILLYFYFNGAFGRGLEYDYATAAVAKRRVAEAQYLPDPDVLAGALPESTMTAAPKTALPSAEKDGTVERIDRETFGQIVDTLGTIDGEGAGKYLGYDIYEIKDEIYFVLDNVPAFGRWFRMPTMREEQGYQEIPYYEWWAYLLEYDELTDTLTVTRVCWATRFNYLDFDKRKTVEDYEDGTSIIQFQAMRTKYWYDDQGRETVECYVYTVAVDHVGDGGKTGKYNGDPDDYYPVSVQYLKNVKDTSLTKYSITLAERYREDESFDEGGYDISDSRPGGSTRNFVQLDYRDNNDIEMLRVSQASSTRLYNRPTTTDIAYYGAGRDTAGLLRHAYDYAAETDSAILTMGDDSLDCFAGDYRGVSAYDRSAGSGSADRITRAQVTASGDASALSARLPSALSALAENCGLSAASAAEYRAAAESAYGGADFAYETAIDGLLDAAAVAAVDGNPLVAEWPQIYKDSDRAVKLETLGEVSAASQAIEAENFSGTAAVKNGTVEYAAEADVPASILLQPGGQYSLGLVFFSDRGDRIVLNGGTAVTFEQGEPLSLYSAGTAALGDIRETRTGVYTLGCLLLKNGVTACSEFLPLDVTACDAIPAVTFEHDGVIIENAYTYAGGRLTLSVTSSDTEPPVVTGIEAGQTITVAAGTTVRKAFSGVRAQDNVRVASLTLEHAGTAYGAGDEPVQAGENTIIARDAAGNETRVTVTVVLV